MAVDDIMDRLKAVSPTFVLTSRPVVPGALDTATVLA